MNDGPVIAILGLSGVGKTHLAQEIARMRPKILRLSASSLLRNSLHTTNEKLRTATSDAVLNNQRVLADALRAKREGQRQRPVLLEAHSIIDTNRELVAVPTDVMRSLGVAGILLIEASPVEIVHRRCADTRVRPLRSSDEIVNQQNLAKEVARRYADELNVPIEVITSGNRNAAITFIDRIVSATVE